MTEMTLTPRAENTVHLLRCPRCHDSLERETIGGHPPAEACPACGSRSHPDCLAEGCAAYGCSLVGLGSNWVEVDGDIYDVIGVEDHGYYLEVEAHPRDATPDTRATIMLWDPDDVEGPLTESIREDLFDVHVTTEMLADWARTCIQGGESAETQAEDYIAELARSEGEQSAWIGGNGNPDTAPTFGEAFADEHGEDFWAEVTRVVHHPAE